MDNNTHNPNFNQASTHVRRRSNKPDIYIQAVSREGNKTYWQDLGATWNTSKEGYAKGRLTINGEEFEIITQTREAREHELSKLKQQRYEAPTQEDMTPC